MEKHFIIKIVHIYEHVPKRDSPVPVAREDLIGVAEGAVPQARAFSFVSGCGRTRTAGTCKGKVRARPWMLLFSEE